MKIIDWLEEHIWKILIVGVVLRYGRAFVQTFILDPFIGDDGKASMDEIAKASIIGVFVWSAVKQGNRKQIEPIFNDEYFLYLRMAVCGIAGVTKYMQMIKKKQAPKESEQQTEQQSLQ